MRHVDGGGPRYDALILASQGSPKCEAQLGVHAFVIAKSAWSWVRPDPLVRDLTQAMIMPATLWKPGYLYAIPTWLYHRTGVERYEVTFWCRDGVTAPERIGAANALDILTLP